MNYEQIIKSTIKSNNSKIILLVLDGVGDIRSPKFKDKTPLEYAHTPNLDKLAKESVVGRLHPVLPGITPGSGPGHVGLFGYDPMNLTIGRGVLEAVGIGFQLKSYDVAARCNFATMNENGIITDRRAGRIPTELTIELCNTLKSIKEIDGVEIIIKPGKGHRFVTVFRSKDKEIGSYINDTDPLTEGKAPLPAHGKNPPSQFLANVINKFIKEGYALIKDKHPANAFLMRGIASKPKLPTMREKYLLESAAIATYPMYRGIASLLGMTLLPAPDSIEGLFETYVSNKQKYDFFFIHVKGTDQAGEDGDFESKVSCIEKVDKALPIILENKPDVLAITGDHSSPCAMRSHSWHPIPLLIHGQFSGRDDVKFFNENACNNGGLGFFESKYLMGLLLANAKRLDKFGA
ncbi:2,3-bisphosphoglycerate-independent phosphoglycerate mutase [Crassaminicella thermophila]|uniref:2,3-bisphosphoglycerate-independent phosphoglycerate mutase n=1 Tax=Crassaminicella thermophila TaxID=2599308 RepID=A0A5C0SIY0_CRATE|nr:2,3-bisphosphoglycerate-independent phosphoglycerate mutase [Crassaminicella thermophila]QEK13178.1 2,3-bisphosphoglycerate-independent phosphoglycerate mutase [Crassaminicella thermophila]